jgi:hypothetical protein
MGVDCREIVHFKDCKGLYSNFMKKLTVKKNCPDLDFNRDNNRLHQ